MNISLREAEERDLSICAKICCEAFTDIANKHNFPSDFPDVASAVALLGPMLSHNKFYGVVGEIEGEVVGSNFLDERGEIVGLGPITVSVAGQNSQVGRLLMQSCLDRCEHRREQELDDAITHGTALVVEEDGDISAYCSSMGYGGFAVSRNDDGLKALTGSVDSYAGPGILLPSGNGNVMR